MNATDEPLDDDGGPDTEELPLEDVDALDDDALEDEADAEADQDRPDLGLTPGSAEVTDDDEDEDDEYDEDDDVDDEDANDVEDSDA